MVRSKVACAVHHRQESLLLSAWIKRRLALLNRLELWLRVNGSTAWRVKRGESLPFTHDGPPTHFPNALKVRIVRVSVMPGMVWTFSLMKWPMSVPSST